MADFNDLSPGDRIMDEFYKNYPDLDPHSADRHCVASILEFVLKEFADIDFVVRDLREGRISHLNFFTRDGKLETCYEKRNDLQTE